MAERIIIEVTNSNDARHPGTATYSWVQSLENRRTHRKVITAIKHGLKPWLERAMKVQIVRRPKFARAKWVTEYHHQSYNRPWCHGRDIADYLISRGLHTNQTVLDFGCGSLRAGIWLIGYLERGRYFGLDADLQSLQAAVEYEIPLHDLEHKQPRFLHSRTFELGHFGHTFDVILASSVLNHLTEIQLDLALRNITSALARSGKLVLAPELPLNETSLRTKYGLDLIHAEKRRSRFIDQEVHWFELIVSTS